MPFGIGPMELVIVFVIALLILGPKRLPEVGRSVGHGIREFKDSISGDSKGDKTLFAEDDDEDAATEPAKVARKAGLSS